MQKLQQTGFVTLALGAALFAFGYYYPDMGKTDSRWPMASEEQLEAARLKAHSLSFKYGSAVGTEDEAKALAELNAAEEEYAKMRVKRDWAVDGPDVTGFYFYWGGILVGTIGVFMLVASRPE